MKENSKDDDSHRSSIKCPKCGYEIPLDGSKNRPLLRIEAPTRYVVPLSDKDQIVSRGDAAFLIEATKHGWSVFSPVTPDVGIDYVIAKGYGAVMIQLKTATLMNDSRYHVTVARFLEGPLGFIVYHFQNVNAFFLIPSTKFWEIPRFKKLKSRVFASGSYPDTLSYEKAKEIMGDYENEKGWELLERLTTPEGLLEAIKSFISKQKRSRR